jgi:hypothetical protein
VHGEVDVVHVEPVRPGDEQSRRTVLLM